MHRFVRGLNALAEPFLDFLYPARCLCCGVPTPATDCLCPTCIAGMLPFPVTRDSSDQHLRTMMAGESATSAAVGFEFEQEGAIADCLHALKYQGLTRVGTWLGRLLGEQWRGTFFLDGDPILVPVPLHRMKRYERGYNQALWICRGLSAETGLRIRDGLVKRARYTDSQSANRLGKQDRRGNVLNAFQVPPTAITEIGAHPVILLDDVITTGATMNACATTLREQGCPEVRYAAVARPSRGG